MYRQVLGVQICQNSTWNPLLVLSLDEYKKVIAVFLFWPDYWVILEGKMSFLKIGKRQHLKHYKFWRKKKL